MFGASESNSSTKLPTHFFSKYTISSVKITRKAKWGSSGSNFFGKSRCICAPESDSSTKIIQNLLFKIHNFFSKIIYIPETERQPIGNPQQEVVNEIAT